MQEDIRQLKFCKSIGESIASSATKSRSFGRLMPSCWYEAEVLLSPASDLMVRLYRSPNGPVKICNLLADCDEYGHKDQAQPSDLLPALISLIEAGALVRVD